MQALIICGVPLLGGSGGQK